MKERLLTIKEASEILGIQEIMLINALSLDGSLSSESSIKESELLKLLSNREIKARISDESSSYEIELSRIEEVANETILFLLLKKENEDKSIDNLFLELRTDKTNFSLVESLKVIKELILSSKISESCCIFIDKNKVEVSEFFRDFEIF
ncbi:MAG: hypothetical protein N2440_02055 [Actinobacteria bacterium]|nr:hypothetical protein [Actinomycetota bacterium]